MERKKKRGGRREKRETSEGIFFSLNNTKGYGSSGMILCHGPETGHCIKLKLGQNRGHSF